jgi:hypothetical protein
MLHGSLPCSLWQQLGFFFVSGCFVVEERWASGLYAVEAKTGQGSGGRVSLLRMSESGWRSLYNLFLQHKCRWALDNGLRLKMQPWAKTLIQAVFVIVERISKRSALMLQDPSFT